MGAPGGSTYFGVTFYVVCHHDYNFKSISIPLVSSAKHCYDCSNSGYCIAPQTTSVNTFLLIVVDLNSQALFAENLWKSVPQRRLQNAIVAYVQLLDGMTNFLMLFSLLSKQNCANLTFTCFVCFWFDLSNMSSLLYASHYFGGLSPTRVLINKDFILPFLFFL